MYTPTGGIVTGIPNPNVLVQGLPLLTGPGPVIPHLPAPKQPQHKVGITQPVRKIFCAGMPVLAATDKCTCGCVVGPGIPNVLIGK